jgi:polyhydroxybutyrate depolymerase
MEPLKFILYSGALLIFFNSLCPSYAYPENPSNRPFAQRLKELFLSRNESLHTSGDYDFKLIHDGLTRTYKVHVPRGYSTNNPLPVVIAFHGGGGNAQASVEFFGLNAKADKENFIVVYPQGSGKKVLGKIFGSWNAGKCCPPARDNNVDDVGFVSKMIDKLKEDFAVDSKRVFATGFSNGALMCYRLACELSEKIAAIAVGGGQDAFSRCIPKSPVAIFHFHGTQDKCAFYNGGTCGGCFADYLNKLGIPADRTASLWECRSVQEYIDDWREINGCLSPGEIAYQKGSATCISYGECRNDVEVTLCTLQESGHTWPGGNYGNKICERAPSSFACREWVKGVGEINRDLSANDMLWEFFKRHPKE